MRPKAAEMSVMRYARIADEPAAACEGAGHVRNYTYASAYLGAVVSFSRSLSSALFLSVRVCACVCACVCASASISPDCSPGAADSVGPNDKEEHKCEYFPHSHASIECEGRGRCEGSRRG